MKKFNYITILLLISMSFGLSSCEVIGGIFKAGMGVGAFAIIAVLVLIIFLVTRVMGRGKN